MKIDFSKNTLIITLYNPDNIGLVWSAIAEMETMLCKKLDVDEDYFDIIKRFAFTIEATVEY